jgi:hypothetical protein
MSPAVEAEQTAFDQSGNAVVKKRVPIDRILEDHSTQIRVSIDPEVVKDYEAIIIDSGDMAPVIGYRVAPESAVVADTMYRLGDGWHRLNSYRNLGKTSIPMEIREGTPSEILECAIVQNCRHGARLTNADKRKAAELAVKDPILGAREDAWISKRLGVSTGFIANVRAGLKPKDIKKRKERAAAASGKTESESPAPKSATARQRRSESEPEEARRPTAAAVLRQIEEHIKLEVIEEQQVIKLFDSPDAAYSWMKKPGKTQMLKIMNKFGRPLLEATVTIKQVNEEVILLTASAKDITTPLEKG